MYGNKFEQSREDSGSVFSFFPSAMKESFLKEVTLDSRGTHISSLRAGALVCLVFYSSASNRACLRVGAQ